MAEISTQIQDKAKERKEDESIFSLGMKIQKEREVYRAYGAGGGGFEEKPTKGEIVTWYFYGFCTNFVLTVLIPIVFPLLISQTVPDLPEPPQGWLKSYKGLKCLQEEMQLYGGLVFREVRVGRTSFSPLEWTSISWITGLLLSAPILGVMSFSLDHGQSQQLIAGAATGIGALFCLPAGFFRKSGIFLPYIAAIVAASTVAGAASSRYLALLIRGFTGSKLPKSQFAIRRVVASKLSLYSTVAGCFGAIIMASFTYNMLNHSDHFTALWVVSIFSGLLWGLGLINIFGVARSAGSSADSQDDDPAPIAHLFSIFRYPFAAASLALIFLSSFLIMCVFVGSLLYAFGTVLALDCTPAGKEGAFSAWFSWARALGTCAGFALAAAMPGNVGKTFGISLCAAIVAMVVLIFGNISSLKGAKTAGHVIKIRKGS
ncbi:hypothetical protein M569_13231, partial [Genlisea aurea]